MGPPVSSFVLMQQIRWEMERSPPKKMQFPTAFMNARKPPPKMPLLFLLTDNRCVIRHGLLVIQHQPAGLPLAQLLLAHVGL